MKIAAQLYTLRNFCKTPDDILKTFHRVKEIGYNYVQASGMGPIDAELLAKHAEDAGVKIVLTHTPFDRIVNDTERLIEEHRIFGCERIGMGAMVKDYATSLEKCDEFCKLIEPVVQKINDAGMKFLYHNHHFEFMKFDGETILERLLSHTDPKTFLLTLDLYWVQAGGASPEKTVKKYGDRIELTHYKDMKIVKGESWYEQHMAPVGEGNLDWKDITKLCEEANVPFAAVEQDDCYGEDPFDCMARSFRYMKDVLHMEYK